MTKPENSTTETRTELSPSEPTEFWTQVDTLFQRLHDGFYPTPWVPTIDSIEDAPSIGLLPAPADITDRGDRFEVQLDVPGVSKDRINVRVVGRTVAVTAEQALEQDEKNGNWLRHERTWNGFHRQIEFPEEVRAEGVRARYENGVLALTIPKTHPVVESTVKVE